MHQSCRTEWVVEARRPYDLTQCLALLESDQLRKRLAKHDVIHCVLAAINGFESDLFVWDACQQRFVVAHHLAMPGLNARPFRQLLQRFCPVATMYRRMSEFAEQQHAAAAAVLASPTLAAFGACLACLLTEIMRGTLRARQCLPRPAAAVPAATVRLVLLEAYLDSAENGRLLLAIRNLYATYAEATIQTAGADLHCQQVWHACHSRLSVPDARVRGLVFTLLEHSLRPLFVQLHWLLTSFRSISELDKAELSECIFRSRFRTDQQLHSPLAMAGQFWDELLFVVEPMRTGTPLFRAESLQWLTEAVKCSLALRTNGCAGGPVPCLFDLVSAFRESMERNLTRYAHPDDHSYDVQRDFCPETEPWPPVADLRRRPAATRQVSHFYPFRMPALTARPLAELVSTALGETLERVSRPIVQTMVAECRARYLRLFRYYADFFLVQRPNHMLLYVHLLFPKLKDRRRGSWSPQEQLVQSLHRALRDEGGCFGFFRAVHRGHHHQNATELDWQLESFHFVPSFGRPGAGANGAPFHDFWPLCQMFGPQLTDLANELFRFLIRLRYFQYLIGNDFLLSSKFRYQDLEKNIYLFRFRLANLVFQFGRQMEYRLQELIQQTEQTLAAERCASMPDLFAAHHKLSERLEQIVHRVARSDFIGNQFRTIAKFCHSNQDQADGSGITDTVRKYRKLSIWKNMNQLDQVRAEDFNF